ncbi:MAG: hypothetical protein FWE67_13780, partial [Planctomycetaceae bacterium]|nr:hypothetical protein [Planctomycetaceae bacterium]
MRKTLLVLGTVVILFAALFRFEFVSADAVGGSRNAGGEPATVSPQPNPVKEGTFTPLQPVQDKKKVKIRGRVLMPNGEVAEGVNWMFAGYGTSDNWKISNGAGPYEPRIDFATLGPEQLKDKETVDLGDILIDSDKAVVEPDAWTVTLFSELADKVKSGEKKS